VTAVQQWLRCCATNRKVARSITAGVIGIFHWHKILPIPLWPQSRISLFPVGKGGRCLKLTNLPPSCAVVMKSGNFNFLEPSGSLQACNGTALPLPLCPLVKGIINHKTVSSWGINRTNYFAKYLRNLYPSCSSSLGHAITCISCTGTFFLTFC